ncbi:MAG TPA: aminotransferase class V-fold PLP-dependent enzyme, partial [Gemmatimonadaceae bacterium]|nr:aminotransferase class V-fold PLP-dependent enzyme [Gemmatimonadaceae bacterium]
PHISGAVGLGAATDFLQAVGRERIVEHERHLLSYALDRMREILDLRVYGPHDLRERSGVISFTLADVHPHDLATILDAEGVAIRAGHHCCQPLMGRLGVPATARASFYVYNDERDVDALVSALEKARALFGWATV